MVRDPTEENKNTLITRQKETNRIIRMNRRQWEIEKLQDIKKNGKSNTHIFFEKANEMKRGFKT